MLITLQRMQLGIWGLELVAIVEVLLLHAARTANARLTV